LYAPDFRKTIKEQTVKIDVAKGKINVFYATPNARLLLREYLYNIFSARRYRNARLAGRIHVLFDGEEIPPGYIPGKMIYIPRPSEIPGDIRAGRLVRFILGLNRVPFAVRNSILSGISPQTLKKTFNRLAAQEQVDIILAFLPFLDGDIFLLDNTCKEMNLDYKIRLMNRMKAITQKGGTVFYLSPEKNAEELTKEPEREILPCEYWERTLESYEEAMSEEDI
jgi:hypothetical protein